MVEKTFYVYALCSPDGVPFYIGRGQGNRVLDHEREARNGGYSARCDRIREIQASGSHVVKKVLFASNDKQEVRDMETQQILLHQHLPLTNRSPFPHERAIPITASPPVFPSDFIPRRAPSININLNTPEEVELYLAMKARASLRDMTLRDFVIYLFRKEAENPHK